MPQTGICDLLVLFSCLWYVLGCDWFRLLCVRAVLAEAELCGALPALCECESRHPERVPQGVDPDPRDLIRV